MAESAARQLLTDTAYGRIKHGIICCELAPGQAITEEQLASGYSVGRAGVRAALKRLCQENLVVLATPKRYLVAPVTLKHVNELFELRELLEPWAARRAAGRLSTETRGALQRLSDVQYATGDHESAAAFLRANTEFHAAIAVAAGNGLVAEVVRATLDKVERVHHMAHLLHDRNEIARDEHHELLAALMTEDGAHAEEIMIRQIRAAKAFVINAIVSSPRLQLANIGVESAR
jgi:DNA-binding GntR family transcriptional regulator